MIEDNPKMNELEDLVKFCLGGGKVFIYGHDITAMNVSKYLFFSEIKIEGFIKPEIYESEKIIEPFPMVGIVEINDLSDDEKQAVKVIICSPEELYNQIIELLRMLGISHFFILSEWNKRTIVKKLAPRKIEDFYLEVNLADHCNLNCQCCDHFSPIAKETFLDYDQYVKDIKRIAELTDGKIGIMKLQGGEPLLNSRIIDYMQITRETFPEALICLFTDGLLLPLLGGKDKDNVWEAIREYEIEVRLTRYPIPLDEERIVKQAESHGIPVTYDPPEFRKGARLWIFSEIGALKYRGVKHSVKHPFDLSGNVEKFRWASCYQFNESIVLRDGKIYTCPMIPYAHFFNEAFDQNLEVKEDCYIDIYQVSTYEQIAEFVTHRTSFCNYCAVHKRSVRDWRQSDHSMEEWVL